MRRVWVTLAVAAALLTVAAPAQAEDGAALFKARCASCHGENGQGRSPFPALADNPILADGALVTQTIRNGRGIMPAFSDFSDGDVAALVSYLQATFGGVTQSTAPGGTTPETGGGQGGTPPPSTEPLLPGDATRGEQYFLGRTRFEGGAPPCVACHKAGGIGGIAGGALGADLTDLFTRMGGEAGIDGALTAPAFKVMRAAFDGKPLTPQERADLASFFQRLSAAGSTEPSLFARSFWPIGALGAGALLLLIAALRPRRHSRAQRLRDTHEISRNEGKVG